MIGSLSPLTSWSLLLLLAAVGILAWWAVRGYRRSWESDHEARRAAMTNGHHPAGRNL